MSITDQISEICQKRFDRFCREVEELGDSMTKTATRAIIRCLEVYERHINDKRN